MKSKATFVIDIGNSRIKAGRFESGELKEVFFFDNINQITLPTTIHGLMICNVSNLDLSDFYARLQVRNTITLSRQLPLPLNIDYHTPNTLGFDRIAAAVGAQVLYPNRHILTIDMGSCITYDILDQNNTFQGGVISPGLRMRLKAMHKFTGNLPDLTEHWQEHYVITAGKSTRSCMSKGVVEGISHEILGQIGHFSREYGDLTIIMTGGDATIFDSKIKAPIFVRPNLVLIGLNRIFEYNDH